ncbi:MAG: isochorismate synthase [Solirubrobacteraceae bacterium]|nr:MAG: isochorismate synthase [Solirubrobacterales bacterium]
MSSVAGLPGAVAAEHRSRVVVCVDAALERARRELRPVLAGVAVELEASLDPTAVVAAARSATEPWFALERPDCEGQALAGLGCAVALQASGPDRFASVSAAWRSLVGDAVIDQRATSRAAGLVAAGGFAFADDGGAAPEWSGFAPASLHVPELAVARQGDRVTATVAVLASPDDSGEELCERAVGRLAQLRLDARLPLLDPAPVGRVRVSAPLTPEHYEASVARAVERIVAGELEKVVLAREVAVHAPVVHDPAALLGVLREAFPACFVFAVGRGEATFLGASPELLVRREGHRASTVALAGSARRSADPAVDDYLGEQLLHSSKDRQEHAIVARRIERTLRRLALWVAAAPEPQLVKIANIQHLATAIRAQLDEPFGAIDLAAALHPTPAVGGEPWERAAPLIRALEGIDRGWYAGAIGWTDGSEDGEFCVALRCALLRGAHARCYAGVGVVADSDPAAELAETEVKLEALLPLLAG